MTNKIILVFKRLFQRNNKYIKKNSYKNIEIYPDDVFLVSYPKSGSTWLRFLIGNYLSDNKCNFDNCHLIIPDIHYNPEQCLYVHNPRIMKSHFPFSAHFMTHKYPKVIYIVRDGRDVAVSYYYYLLRTGKIQNNFSFDEYISMFNDGKIDNFSNWSIHINSWMDYMTDNFLIVRYEDLKKDTNDSLLKVLFFLGFDIDQKRIKKAVEASQFENMKRLDRNRTSFIKDIPDKSIPFVREGKSGGWVNFFNDKLHDDFLYVHSTALKRLGYI